MAERDELDGFDHFSFGADGRERVYCIEGRGPGVLIVHELPGMTQECLRLARRIAKADYSVYLPLLFGDAGHRLGTVRQLCIMQEWNALAKRNETPMTVWIREVGREVHRRCGGPGIGAIGMCLTGGFIIPLLLDEHVLAPVASQPSLPWAFRHGETREALGFEADLLDRAGQRARDENIKVLAFRFARDWICPAAKFRGLQRVFGSQLEKHELRGRKHSVLTKHYRQSRRVHRPRRNGPKSIDAIEETIAFLDRALKNAS